MNCESFPKVVIGIPAFNQGPFLPFSLESALNQDYPNFEVLVSNDASLDETASILREFRKKHNNLIVKNQSVNLGFVGNCNWLFSHFDGDYLLRLDADDLLEPCFLSELVRLLINFPQAGYAHGAVKEIDEKGKVLKFRGLARSNTFLPWDISLRESIYGVKTVANICLFRKEVFEKVGGYDPLCNFVADWDFSARIAKAHFGNVYSPKILASYRVWMDSQKFRLKRKIDEWRGIKIIFDRFEESFFQEKWNIQDVRKVRQKRAIQYSLALADKNFTSLEKQEIIKILKEIGNSKRLNLQIRLIKSGFGSILKFIDFFMNGMFGAVKKPFLLFIKFFGGREI